MNDEKNQGEDSKVQENSYRKQRRGSVKDIGAMFMQGFLGKTGRILAVIAVVFIFWGGIRIGRLLYGSHLTGSETQITEQVLYQQLEQIGELATVKYFYTDMGKYENSLQLGSADIPLTRKSFIISYDGVIKAGINMDKVAIELDGRTVRITLPQAEILSHEVDDDSVTVYDEKSSIFNGLSVEDVLAFQEEQKEKMEERAVANGILADARENAQMRLRLMYETVLGVGKEEPGAEGYVVEIQ